VTPESNIAETPPEPAHVFLDDAIVARHSHHVRSAPPIVEELVYFANVKPQGDREFVAPFAALESDHLNESRLWGLIEVVPESPESGRFKTGRSHSDNLGHLFGTRHWLNPA